MKRINGKPHVLIGGEWVRRDKIGIFEASGFDPNGNGVGLHQKVRATIRNAPREEEQLLQAFAPGKRNSTKKIDGVGERPFPTCIPLASHLDRGVWRIEFIHTSSKARCPKDGIDLVVDAVNRVGGTVMDIKTVGRPRAFSCDATASNPGSSRKGISHTNHFEDEPTHL